ncbi:MAG: hypothetical protein EBU93_04575, partial [Chlamydiae bacterium]|nr:hypothetical protein [Chlamydiota bacterium]
MAKKFEYIDFPESAIFPIKEESSSRNNEPLNTIISEHVAAMISEAPSGETIPTLVDSSFLSEATQDESIIKEGIIDEAQPTDDMEKIKKEFFDEGYSKGQEEAKKIFDENLAQQKNESEFLQNIINQLNSLPVETSSSGEYVDLIAAFLDELKEKIIVHFPTDFSKVVSAQLKKIIDNSYNSGKIIFRVSAENCELVEKIIKSDKLSLQVENIEVIPDLKIAKTDCVLEYNCTKLVYDILLIK